jgi:hypothetical protein
MVSVRHGFVTAVRPMNVIGLMRSALVVRGTFILICRACLQAVFVNVVPMNMVQMAIVKVIGMAVVLDGCVAAIGPVDMSMPFMFAASRSHHILLVCWHHGAVRSRCQRTLGPRHTAANERSD